MKKFNIIKYNLNQHSCTTDDFSFKVIHDIVYDEPKVIVVAYKENLLWDEDTEFLKRFYNINESINRLPKIGEYYHLFSIKVPNYSSLFNFKKILIKYISKKQKILEILEDKYNRDENTKLYNEVNTKKSSKVLNKNYDKILNDSLLINSSLKSEINIKEDLSYNNFKSILNNIEKFNINTIESNLLIEDRNDLIKKLKDITNNNNIKEQNNKKNENYVTLFSNCSFIVNSIEKKETNKVNNIYYKKKTLITNYVCKPNSIKNICIGKLSRNNNTKENNNINNKYSNFIKYDTNLIYKYNNNNNKNLFDKSKSNINSNIFYQINKDIHSTKQASGKTSNFITTKNSPKKYNNQKHNYKKLSELINNQKPLFNIKNNKPFNNSNTNYQITKNLNNSNYCEYLKQFMNQYKSSKIKYSDSTNNLFHINKLIKINSRNKRSSNVINEKKSQKYSLNTNLLLNNYNKTYNNSPNKLYFNNIKNSNSVDNRSCNEDLYTNIDKQFNTNKKNNIIILDESNKENNNISKYCNTNNNISNPIFNNKNYYKINFNFKVNLNIDNNNNNNNNNNHTTTKSSNTFNFKDKFNIKNNNSNVLTKNLTSKVTSIYNTNNNSLDKKINKSSKKPYCKINSIEKQLKTKKYSINSNLIDNKNKTKNINDIIKSINNIKRNYNKKEIQNNLNNINNNYKNKQKFSIKIPECSAINSNNKIPNILDNIENNKVKTNKQKEINKNIINNNNNNNNNKNNYNYNYNYKINSIVNNKTKTTRNIPSYKISIDSTINNFNKINTTKNVDYKSNINKGLFSKVVNNSTLLDKYKNRENNSIKRSNYGNINNSTNKSNCNNKTQIQLKNKSSVDSRSLINKSIINLKKSNNKSIVRNSSIKNANIEIFKQNAESCYNLLAQYNKNSNLTRNNNSKINDSKEFSKTNMFLNNISNTRISYKNNV